MTEFDFDIEKIWRDRCPSIKFKGGGGGYSEPPKPSLSPMGQWSQSKLYETVQRGLSGGGLLPFNKFAPMRQAFKKGYAETKPEMASYLNRMVPKGDTTVRNYAGDMLKRSYYGGLYELGQQEKLAPYEDQQEAMGMATQYLAGEKQMSADIMSIYNQGRMMQSQMPTFGSQLGYGLGSAGGMLAGQRYAQLMSNQEGMV